jgi:hypothetical protein
MLQTKPRFLLIAYALVLSVEAGANIAINFVGKGRTWDLYPLAELFWVACSARPYRSPPTCCWGRSPRSDRLTATIRSRSRRTR